jgi:hypothetical protein
MKQTGQVLMLTLAATTVSIEQIQDLAWLSNQKLRPIFQQLLLAPKSPERSNRAHTGGAGRLHVNSRIPNIKAFSRWNSQSPGDFYGTGRIRFARELTARPKDHIESPLCKQLVHAPLRKVVRLV